MKFENILVVSGIPRSGTSLMMKMLEAAGVPIQSDGERQADLDNPKGYYEFERVKQLDKGDTEWLEEARGKAVKIISPLLKYLPDTYYYDVIFMRRELSEVLASQRKMLERNDKEAGPASDEKLAALFKAQLEQSIAWAKGQNNFRVIAIDYGKLVAQEAGELKKVADFLPEGADTTAMAGVIDPSLYRQRAKN